MFWNKKKKKKEEAPAETIPADSPLFPALKQGQDGSFRLDFNDLKPLHKPKYVTDRIYVISRGNIDLKEAQNITVYAAKEHPEFFENLMPDKHVDLIWCSAYPETMFGEYDLSSLLTGYINRTEGNQYIKGNSPVLPIKGTKDGDEFFILVLVHPEF